MIHLNTKEFAYDKSTQTFSQEASTLEGEHPSFFDHQQIELQSQNTRACKTFTYVELVRDNDGDIVYWSYKSDDGLLIKVIND